MHVGGDCQGLPKGSVGVANDTEVLSSEPSEELWHLSTIHSQTQACSRDGDCFTEGGLGQDCLLSLGLAGPGLP